MQYGDWFVSADIAKALGIKHLTTLSGNENIRIYKFWLVRATYSAHSGDAFMAVVTSDRWKKGVIIVPKQEKDSYERVSLEPDTAIIEVVDLETWHDPVEDALHNLDVMYDDGTHDHLVGKAVYSYDIEVQTWYSETNINGRFGNKSISEAKLWRAIRKTTWDFAQICENDYVRRFVDTMPHSHWVFGEFKQDKTED